MRIFLRNDAGRIIIDGVIVTAAILLAAHIAILVITMVTASGPGPGGKHGEYAPMLTMVFTAVYVPAVVVVQLLYVMIARALPWHWPYTLLQLYPLGVALSIPFRSMPVDASSEAVVMVPLLLLFSNTMGLAWQAIAAACAGVFLVLYAAGRRLARKRS